MLFVQKKINFSENKTESKMENPTHNEDTKYVIGIIEEPQIKNETVMIWSSQKIELQLLLEHFFSNIWKRFIPICVIY